MYACQIQNWKFGSVLTAACPTDSRKAYCKLCNNAIINTFFAFNCCKKSKWYRTFVRIVRSCWYTSAPRKCDTVQNAPCCFKQSSRIRNVFHFFLVKSAMQNYFHNVQVSCYCCVTWYETRTIFSLLYSNMRWSFRGVMLLHVAMVRAGSFAVLIYLHSSILAFGRGAYN